MATVRADIVAALYEGVTDDGRLDRALGLLAEEFDSPSIALLSIDAHAPGADVWSARGIFGRPDALEAYRTHFGALDPAPAAFAQTPWLTATTTEELIRQGRIRIEETRTRAFVNEYYRQIGLDECLGANLSTRNGQTALIGLHRGPDRRPFGSDEIALLEAYCGHIAQMLRLRQSLGESRLKASLLGSVIERMAAGVAIRDGEGRSVHVNRAALDIAARGDGLGISRDGTPFSPLPAANQALRRLYAQIKAGGEGGVVSFPRSASSLPYTLLATALPETAATTFHAAGGRPVLVVIHDPDARMASSAEIVAKAFGLPPRTADMLLAMAEGEDAATYAERHGISRNAIKFHLRTAFTRTGLHRQAELLKAVVRAISDLGRRG